MCLDFCMACDWCNFFEVCMDKEFFPELTEFKALICLILNCIPITSGFGTMVSACCDWKKNSCTIILVGLAQFVLTFLIVGWIWSIKHGIKLYMVNSTPKPNLHANVVKSQTTPKN